MAKCKYWNSFMILADVQKLLYLNYFLVDPANLLTENTPVTIEGYKLTLDALKARYNQPHKIRDAFLKAMIKLPKPTQDKDSSQKFVTNDEVS